MANILETYGIKEVADVTFYKLNADGTPANPVLYLDTLKVSTIEQTAENVTAKGGKGNAELIAWDFGKAINVTITDALYSAKSMAIMFGDGTTSTVSKVLRTFKANKVTGYSNGGAPIVHEAGQTISLSTYTVYDDQGSSLGTNSAALSNASAAYVTAEIGAAGQKIVISADTFPDTYYVTGDTYARKQANGDDDFFQFIIPKAKVLSENTITLEAEGDPSVFNLNLKVLRPDNGEMMQLVQYTLPTTPASVNG